MSDDAKEAKTIKKKKVYEMSNTELRKINERKNLERNYRSLNPNAIKRGMAAVGTIAAGMGTIVAIQKNGKKIVTIGKNIVNRYGKVAYKVGKHAIK